jgi:hypothetical protein
VRFRRLKEAAEADVQKANATVATQASRLQQLESDISAVEDLTRKRCVWGSQRLLFRWHGCATCTCGVSSQADACIWLRMKVCMSCAIDCQHGYDSGTTLLACAGCQPPAETSCITTGSTWQRAPPVCGW